MNKFFKLFGSIIFASQITLLSAQTNQSTSVFDANYFNQDNIAPPIKIGKGFHINDIYKQTRSCFTLETSNSKKLTPQQTGGKKTSIKVFYTKTNEQYNDFKSKGASGKVSCLNLFTLGGKKLEEYSNKSIEKKERLIFTANVDFGIYSFDIEPTLNPEAKALLTQNKPQDYTKFYGTHYISGIRKESSISVILTKTSSKNENSENTDNSLQAGTNIPIKGSGSFEVSDSRSTNKMLEENDFSIIVEINGPAIEQSAIQGQINNIINGDIQDKALEISKIIESAIKNISDPNQSVITQYYYSPFSLYGLDGIYWDGKKESQLTKINETVLKVYSSKSKLDELITQSGKAQIEQELRNKGVTENYISQITGKYNEVLPKLESLNQASETYLKDLEAMYVNCSDVFCQSNSNCCSIDGDINNIKSFNLEKKIEDELNKVMAVIYEVANEMSKPECEKNNQGIIEIKNLSSNPYSLYRGNTFLTSIPGKSTQTYNVNLGTYYFKAVQNSGYVMYPTENKRSANISKVCEKVTLKIGFED